MSAIGFLGLLVIAIIVLMLLMVKAKLHPVMSLFIVALGFGALCYLIRVHHLHGLDAEAVRRRIQR